MPVRQYIPLPQAEQPRLALRPAASSGPAPLFPTAVEGLPGCRHELNAALEFALICHWLGQCPTVDMLDRSPDGQRAPTMRAGFAEGGGPCLIEVKVKAEHHLSFKADHLEELLRHAGEAGQPLLIAWKHYSTWLLFDARHLRQIERKFRIGLDEARRQNLMGILAGDIAFTMAEGAGVSFDLLGPGPANQPGKPATLTAFHFLGAGGQPRDDLPPQIRQLFAFVELQERWPAHPADRHRLLEAGDNMGFAHQMLVRSLQRQAMGRGPHDWRAALGDIRFVQTLEAFAAILEQARAEEIVSHIFQQRPHDAPDFMPG